MVRLGCLQKIIELEGKVKLKITGQKHPFVLGSSRVHKRERVIFDLQVTFLLNFRVI